MHRHLLHGSVAVRLTQALAAAPRSIRYPITAITTRGDACSPHLDLPFDQAWEIRTRAYTVTDEDIDALRGTYGIKAPAPICPDPVAAADLLAGGDPATCQVVQAPAGDGKRLVPDVLESRDAQVSLPSAGAGDDQEIRLTYRELSALIENAIRSLR